MLRVHTTVAAIRVFENPIAAVVGPKGLPRGVEFGTLVLTRGIALDGAIVGTFLDRIREGVGG